MHPRQYLILILLAASFFLSIFSLSTCNFVTEYSRAQGSATTKDSSVPTKRLSTKVDVMVDLLLSDKGEGVGVIGGDFIEGRKKLSKTSDIKCSFPCISDTAGEYEYDSEESRRAFHYYGLLASQPRGKACQFRSSPASNFSAVCVAIAIILTCRNFCLVYMERRIEKMEILQKILRFPTAIVIVLFLTSIIVMGKTRCKSKCSLGVGMIVLLCVVVIQAVVWYTLYFPLRKEVAVMSDESNEEQSRTSSKNEKEIQNETSSNSSEHSQGDLEKTLRMIDSEHGTMKSETRKKCDFSQPRESVVTGNTSVTFDGVSDVSGFIIVGLILLMGDMYRGVMYPTLWPLVKSLGGTQITQGFIVASFNVGRTISSPIFGSCCTKLGYRKTYILSTTICLMGTFIYSQITNVGGLWLLIISQFLMGTGSGTQGVSYAFVADVTPTVNRTKYLGWASAMQYFGYTVTPFIGSLLTGYFGNNANCWKVGIVNMNMYSAPGYFMFLVTALVITVLLVVFTDRTKPGGNRKKKKILNNLERFESQELTTVGGVTAYDFVVITCAALYICSKGSASVFETLGIKIAMDHFGMKSRSAGYVVAVSGFVGVIALLCAGKIAICRQDIQMVLLATIATLLSSGSLALLHKQQVYNPWRYILGAFFIYSFGYPVGNNSTLSLFSKIVGRRPQGKLMGWLASAGSMTRIVVPITTGYISKYGGDVAPFRILSSVLAINTVLLYLFRDRIQEYTSIV